MIDEQTSDQNKPPHKPRVLPNILVTGVPGTGKTTLSKLLADQLNTVINTNLQTSKTYYEHLNIGSKTNLNLRRDYKRKPAMARMGPKI